MGGEGVGLSGTDVLRGGNGGRGSRAQRSGVDE